MGTSQNPRKARPVPVLAAALAGASTFALYAITSARNVLSVDVVGASLASWRIATTGAPWLEGIDVASIEGRTSTVALTSVMPNGHETATRSPGVVVAGVPAYFLRQGGTSTSDFSVVPGALTAALLTTIALFLFWLTLRLYVSDREALVMVTALGLTTPMWSVSGHSLWTHSVTVVGVAGMAWAASRERWWLMGLFGGVGLWGRLHVALVVALLGLGLALWRRTPSIALKAGATSGLSLLLAAAWARWMYGVWRPQGGYGSGSDFASAALDQSIVDHVVNQAGLWISADRGLLVWSPILLVTLIPMIRSWNELPDWSRVLVVGGMSYTVVQGLLDHFAGGEVFYSYRLTLETLVCCFPAAALSMRAATRAEWRVAVPVLGLQLGAISIGAITNGFFVARDDAWTDNSLALAIRSYPVPVVFWLVICLATAYTLRGASVDPCAPRRPRRH